MADDDLDAIRARRLAELQGQNFGAQGDEAAKEEERKKQAEAMVHNILTQVLDQAARSRLNTIMMAKPEKGKMIQQMLVNMARSGRIQTKLGEEEFKQLLEQFSGATEKKTKVKFDRRRVALDSDDED